MSVPSSLDRMLAALNESDPGDDLLIEGFDVTEVNDAGLVTRVLGFFDPIPTLETD